jgi:putative ABC transport system permease protein
MIFLPTIRLALRALRRNLLRTLLTMLGIIIGVAAVIAVVSIGNGAKKQVEAQIATMGQNVILVMSGNVSRGGFSMGFGSAGTLTQPDLDSIRKEVEGVAGVSPEVRVPGAQLAVGNQNANVQVSGVSADYVDIRAWRLKAGENFTEQDIRTAAKVALIGQTTKKTLFGDSDAVGQIVRIKSAPFIVVGELAAKGMNMMGFDRNMMILIGTQ